MQGVRRIQIETLTDAAFAEFGWVLGGAFPMAPDGIAFGHTHSDFWHSHDFDPGAGGDTEVLWVNYRDASLRPGMLEAHWLTEQALVPLAGGDVVQLVCPTRVDGSRQPDLGRLRAFRIGAGLGICMRPGCWHSSCVLGGPATCLMLTRRSTTRDLVAHLKGGATAQETSFAALGEPGAFELFLHA